MIIIEGRTHNFKESLEAGRRGEEVIIEWVKSLPITLDVVDTRGDPEHQRDDIDFIHKRINNKEYEVEIKTDKYTSGNIFFETVSAVETNSLGCMYKTKAKFIVYYFSTLNKAYVIDAKQFSMWMRKLIAEGCPNAEFKQFYNERYDGSQYTSQGYTIPLLYVKYNFPKKYCVEHLNIIPTSVVEDEEVKPEAKELN